MNSEFETISGTRVGQDSVKSTHSVNIITEESNLSENKRSDLKNYIKLIPKQFPSLSVASVSISENKINFEVGSLLDPLSNSDIQNKVDKFTKLYKPPVSISDITITQEKKGEEDKFSSTLGHILGGAKFEENEIAKEVARALSQRGKENETLKALLNNYIIFDKFPKFAKDVNEIKDQFQEFNSNKQLTETDTIGELFDDKEKNFIMDLLRGKDLHTSYDQEESRQLILQLLAKLQWIQLSLIKAMSGKIQLY